MQERFDRLNSSGYEVARISKTGRLSREVEVVNRGPRFDHSVRTKGLTVAGALDLAIQALEDR